MMLDVLTDNKGTVWIGTLGGLLQFIPSQNKFIHYNITSDNPLDNRIKTILIDRKNRFWVATYNGLWRFYPDTKKFERIIFGDDKLESLGLILAMTEGSDGKLWIGYWGKGLRYFDPETGVGRRVFQEEASMNVEGVAEVSNLQGGHDIWCGNLMKVDNKGKTTIYSIRTNPPITNYHITKLYRSNDGLLWACALNKGAMIMNPMKQFFNHHYFSLTSSRIRGWHFSKKNKNLYHRRFRAKFPYAL